MKRYNLFGVEATLKRFVTLQRLLAADCTATKTAPSITEDYVMLSTFIHWCLNIWRPSSSFSWHRP